MVCEVACGECQNWPFGSPPRQFLDWLVMAAPVESKALERKMGLKPGSLEDLAKVFASGAGYRIIKIPAGQGRYRRVARPTVSVGVVLKVLRKSIESQLDCAPQDCVHGCVAGRSILTNAASHLARPVVLRVDVRRFFESISTARVQKALVRAGMDEPGAHLVALCTTLNGSLATGFSTSPLLANLCFDPTDSALTALAQGAHVTYTRYVDDLVFSGASIDDNFLEIIRSQLLRDGWTVNEKKTRFMRQGGPQYVTGLSVDDPTGPHVPRRTKRFLRLEVNYVARKGFSASSVGRDRLFGMINFVKHVNPDLGHRLHAELRDAGRITGWQPEDDEETFEIDFDELYFQNLNVPDEW